MSCSPTGGGPAGDPARLETHTDQTRVKGGRRKTKKVHKRRRHRGGAHKVVKHTDGKYYVVNTLTPVYNNPFNTEEAANAELRRIATRQLTQVNTYREGIPGDSPSRSEEESINEPEGVRVGLAIKKLREDQYEHPMDKYLSDEVHDMNPEYSRKPPKAVTRQTTTNAGRRITRRGHWRYIRGMKIRVPARRIRDVGAPGKWTAKHGPGIGELKPGGLMGYSPSMSKTARHKTLRKAVKAKGALPTFRRLNALATYTKRTAKSKSRTAKADRNWVKKTYM